MFAATPACALHAELPASARTTTIVDDRCGDPPAASDSSFRRRRNRMFARLGDPRHRGVDLIAVETDPAQAIAGKLAYTAIDKDLGGEIVEVHACVEATWVSLGTARTGSDGRFAIALTGARRLRAGMHELAGVVAGDGTSFRFLAFVARTGEQVIVTDVDGTITGSENAILNTVLFGDDIAHRRHAPEALAASGKTVVYLTARGDQFTEVTRRWLRAHGFPVGPLRLARDPITKPGKRTIAFKTAALGDLSVPVAAAIGNKPTDVVAYTAAGIPASRIFVKLPEFEDDLRAQLAARQAIGFHEYRSLVPILSGLGR